MNPANGTSTVVAGGTILEARHLMLSFGETPAIRGASLSVKRGEIVAVMGPSGSGKSTLLHCLAGILVPDAGEVHFDGQRLDSMREAERSRLRRDRFGFVFQFGQLVPELTAEENVALPLLLGGTHREEALRQARSWFERLDLQGMERHRTGEMSGGQSRTRRVGSWPRRKSRRALRGRTDWVARLAERGAGDGPVRLAARVSRGRR